MKNKLVLDTEFNRPFILNDNLEKQVKLRLDVYPSDEIRRKAYANENKKVGTDICIVLDSSGSMDEPLRGEMKWTGKQEYSDGKVYNISEFIDETGITKRDAAIQAIEKLIPLLRPEDTISLLAYDDNPYIMFEGWKSEHASIISESLQKTKYYNGNTNISLALKEARKILSKMPENRFKRIIFLTDGHPTAESEEAGVFEGKAIAEYNITIDCLGIGKDYNYDFLQKIAIPSRGITRKIDTPEEAEDLYRNLFKSSQNLLVTNIQLKLHFHPAVRVGDSYRGLPEQTYLGKLKYDTPDTRIVTFKLGDMERDKKQRYLFNITLPANPDHTDDMLVARAEVSYDLHGLSTSRETSNKDINIEYTSNLKLSKQVNGSVESQYTLAEITKLEAEIEKLINNKSKKPFVYNCYVEIVQRYTQLSMAREAEMYRNILGKFEKDEKITQNEKNALRNATSTAARESSDLEPINPFPNEEWDPFGERAN